MSQTTAENVHERVHAWQYGAGRGLELHQYLGWTWKQYACWVKTGQVPSDIASVA